MSSRSSVRIPAAVLLIAAAAVLAHYFQVWAAVSPVGARTSDFAGTYAASTLWRSGSGSSMYDIAAQEAVSRAAGAPATHLFIPFENPPLAAVVAAPLSLLDATDAYRVWSLVEAAVLAAAIFIVARAAPWPAQRPRLSLLACSAVVIAGFGTGLLLLEGQWDGPPTLGLALAYAGWRRGHRIAPGFAAGFGFALTKPHLAAGLVAFTLGRRDWRGLAGMAAGATSAGALGLLLAGPPATAGFIRALLEPVNSPTAQMFGSSGLVGSLLGSGNGPYVLALLLAAAATVAAGWLGAVTARRAALLEPAFLGAVALSLWASPHLLGHDLVVLEPALLGALAWSMRRELAGAAHGWPGAVSAALIGGWVVASFANMFDLGRYAVGPPGRLMPWVLGGAAALLLWLVRRACDEWPSTNGFSLVVDVSDHPARRARAHRILRHDADGTVGLEHAE